VIWAPADTLSEGEVSLWFVPQLWSVSVSQCRARRQKSYQSVMVNMIKCINFDSRVQPGSHIFAYIRQCTLRFKAISGVCFWATAAGPARVLEVARFAENDRTELSRFIVAQSMALTRTSEEA
jgi:hypothetical protein